MSVTRKGRVARRIVAPGSKSEHEAVVLESDDDGFYILRRRGGNPFMDPQLEGLVGKRISAEGRQLGPTLVIDEWHEI